MFYNVRDPRQQKFNRWVLRKLGVPTPKPVFLSVDPVLHYGTVTFNSFLLLTDANDVYDPLQSFGQIVCDPRVDAYAFMVMFDDVFCFVHPWCVGVP